MISAVETNDYGAPARAILHRLQRIGRGLARINAGVFEHFGRNENADALLAPAALRSAPPLTPGRIRGRGVSSAVLRILFDKHAGRLAE